MLLESAYEGGIRILDTASAYPNSELRIGNFISATKFNFEVVSKTPSLNDVNDSNVRRAVLDFCQHSLDRLRLDCLFGYLLHNADDIARPGTVDALAEIKERDMSKSIGVSIYDPDQGFLALETGIIDIIQVPFNVFDRRFFTSGLATACKDSGVSVFARSVYLQGLLAVPPLAVPEALAGMRPFLSEFSDIANDYMREPQEIALRYVLDHSEVSSAIFGANHSTHVDHAIEILNSPTLEVGLVQKIHDLAEQVPAHFIDPRFWPR